MKRLICFLFGHQKGPFYQSQNVMDGDTDVHYSRTCRCGLVEKKVVPIGEAGCYWTDGCVCVGMPEVNNQSDCEDAGKKESR